MHAAAILCLSGLLLLSHAPGVPAQAPPIARASLRGLEKVAVELAKAGREAEWRELLEVLGDLGLPAKELAALRGSGEKELAKPRARKSEVARAAKLLRDAAKTLETPLIEAPDGPSRVLLATQLARLDSRCAAAQEALGRERVGEAWAPPGEAERAKRRTEIQAAVQRARRLPVEIEARASGDELMQAVLGRPAVELRHGRIVVHFSRNATQATSVFRQALRGAALSEYLATGKLEVPDFPANTMRMFASKSEYLRAVEEASRRGLIDAETAAQSKELAGFYMRDGSPVDCSLLDSEAQGAILIWLDHNRLRRAVLNAGHFNWICKALYGAGIPVYTWTQTIEQRPDSARTSSSRPSELARREELLRLADAGLLGSRTWMRYLAQRREDPPWRSAMLPELGQITGEDLLKATFVYEYLIESGTLASLAAAIPISRHPGDDAEVIAKALGEGLEPFEARWRTWICGIEEGLAQRLEMHEPPVPPSVQATLRALHDVRERAFGSEHSSTTPAPPPTLDEELSRGCLAHAAYLERHPEMAAAWPDAHEQRPDHPEWSSAGAWAGAHSVIAPGAKDGAAAIEQWMGTFYHRLPLLDPGLRRIGLGQSGSVVVLDCASMVQPLREEWLVVWPPSGATKVPTRFIAELPNPVPGEDQSSFGYPITLQHGPPADRQTIELEMTLRDGTAEGAEVPCWFSTPQNPTNPDLAPPGCFALIPKARLRSGATYTVIAKFATGRKLEWSFRT